MESSHRALSDVKTMYAVLRNDLFWSNRFRAIQKSIVDGVPSTCEGVSISLLSHDSDASDSSSDSENDGGKDTDDETEEEDNATNVAGNNNKVVGDFWRNGHFSPTDVPTENFQEAFTSSCHSGVS